MAARARGLVPVLLVLLLAAIPRVAWYRAHPPDLPPDSYGYLNVARELRGDREGLGTWDDRAQLPSDNLAARTPGYPLYLNAVFAFTGHSPTPADALDGPRRLLEAGTVSAARGRHLRHLQTDENVRAVQASQHIVGVAATVVAYVILVEWTGSVGAAVVGALAAIGWNPIWIMVLEPSVLAELISGALLVLAMWLAAGSRESLVRDHAAVAASACAVAARPAMLFAALPLVAWLAWEHRRRPAVAATMPAALIVIVMLLVVGNGVRYGYWGISSVGGATMLSHAADHPEGLREPVRAAEARYGADLRAGATLPFKMSTEGGRPYLDVAEELNAAAIGFAIDHPLWYLTSVAGALRAFLSPPFRFVPGSSNAIRDRLPWIWMALGLILEGLVVAGGAAAFLGVPAGARVAAWMFLVSAVGTSLTAHTENHRFAMPVVQLALMAGVAGVTAILRGGWRGSPEPSRPTI